MPVSTEARRWTTSRFATRALLVLVAAISWIAAGCSASVSVGSTTTPTATPSATAPGTVGKTDLEKQVSDQLAQKVGQTPKSVTCPGDLAAQTGTTMRCVLTANDGTMIGLTVTVTSVDTSTNKVNFDIQVDNTPVTSPTS